jgi:O-methyltransferase involved in polyketide biosynthesis
MLTPHTSHTSHTPCTPLHRRLIDHRAEAFFARRRPGPALPMLIVAEGLLDALPAAEVRALLRAVGDHAPPGTLLLADAAADAPAAPLLSDAAALSALRLRCDERHRLPEAPGLLRRWVARLVELVRGRPARALYELGVNA